MGAWNYTPFGNDTAGDWLFQLEKAKDSSVLRAPLRAVLRRNKIPDAPTCEEAIAAAAVVRAARCQPVGKVPAEAKQWITERGFVPINSLVILAERALRKILIDSELRTLWAESGRLLNWKRELSSLVAGLQSARRKAMPERQPKMLTTRLSLPKLVERADPSKDSPAREVLRKKLEALTEVNAVVAGMWGRTALDLVASRGLIAEAKRLIERGAKVNLELRDPNSKTPLEHACTQGRAEMAEFLLKRGARIRSDRLWDTVLPNGTIRKRRCRSQRCLWYAVQSGSVATVQVLIKHGADLRETFDGATLLHAATESLQDNSQIIEFLVRHGLNVEARDSDGRTAYYRAATTWNKPAILKLISLGADINAKNLEGDTALDFVDGPGPARKVAALLRKHGALLASEIRTT